MANQTDESPSKKFNKSVRSLRPSHLILSFIVLILGAQFARSLVTSPNFQWGVVRQYMFSGVILKGLLLTLELTAVSVTFGFFLAIVLALMRLSGSAIASMASQVYLWVFRGTPLLVQLIFWFNLGALYQRLGIGIPFGPTFISASTNSLISPFSAAILGLGLCSAAYMSEVIRGGIQSIHRGQSEAAEALGLTRMQTLHHVIMPQAMRVIIPPVGNEVIGMLKYSSIVSVIAVPELLYTAELIYARTFQTIPLLIVASIWYLIVTTILTIAQRFVERHYARGVRGLGRSGTRIPLPAAMQSGSKGGTTRMSASTVPSSLNDSRPTMAKVAGVRKSYGQVEVLHGIELAVLKGEVVCLIGPSGSGKSTLLRCLNFLEEPDHGEVYVDGTIVGFNESNGQRSHMHEKQLCAQRSGIGMVFQSFNLFPHMTAIENITLAPRKVHGDSAENALEEAIRLLTLVGLGGLGNTYPGELSGGQQQRVAIARALAMRPALILFDEPTSSLDPELVGEVLDVMRGLANDGMTMIIATHELAFARDVADRLIFMDEGMIVEEGPSSQVLQNPQQDRTRNFIRRLL